MGASNFWGTDGQYKYLHRWIGKTAGKPHYCERADGTCKGGFEWANKSGNYLKVVSDWVRLCRSHHRRYDDAVSTHAVLRPKTHCNKGHELVEGNLEHYTTPAGKTTRRCLICRRTRDLDRYYRVRKWQRGRYATEATS